MILQVSALSQTTIFGGQADLVPLAVAAVALYAGSVPGAATGFAAGFLLDLRRAPRWAPPRWCSRRWATRVGRFREVRDPATA